MLNTKSCCQREKRGEKRKVVATSRYPDTFFASLSEAQVGNWEPDDDDDESQDSQVGGNLKPT